jgi:hypothetical protein
MKLADLRNLSCIDREAMALRETVEKLPANDVAPTSGKRRKQWSETLRSADLATVLERFR